MFVIKIIGITKTEFEKKYKDVLKNINNGTSISVSEFMKIFHHIFGTRGIEVISWANTEFPENMDREKYEWTKIDLCHYNIRFIIGGMFLELKEPLRINELPEKHDIKTEYSCLMLENPEKSSKNFDSVHNPSHYTQGRKYEPRKVIYDWGLDFNLGNAVKYISRAGRKENKIEDLKKAIQYIEFEIDELTNKEEKNHE